MGRKELVLIDLGACTYLQPLPPGDSSLPMGLRLSSGYLLLLGCWLCRMRHYCRLQAPRLPPNDTPRCLRAVGHPSPPHPVHVAYGCWG